MRTKVAQIKMADGERLLIVVGRNALFRMCAEMMDVTRDEAKRILRRLELEAYSSIISAFRAQGDLSRSKKKILQELGTQLSISTERHRAEVRRAHSDDRLAVVAESVYGPGSCAEWAAEGRRLVPLMPRLVPQTVFSASATAAANTASAANAKALASSGNKSASGIGISNLSVSTSGGSSTEPSPLHQQSNNSVSSLKSQPQTGGTHAIDADGFDDDGKPKKRRRLSVSSLSKPVTKVAVPTSLVTKPLPKTTSVSTMTKAGKSLGPLGTVKTAPRISSLSASASQVKLLTKTVAVTQTVCQAKTVLSYKTITSATSSPVKVQTVMTQSTPKTHTKITPATPSKIMLTPKTSSAVKSTSMPSAASPVVTTSPIPVTLKTTTLTAAQLAGRQRVKQMTTRFKPLPGTVKFKTVTPATMGTGSTVTMVTPTPSSQASSAVPVSGSQPVVRVIHVPGTGGGGVSKPVVVMTTGLSKSTVGGVLPVPSGASLTKATSQITQSLSVGKPPVSTATSLPSPTTSVQTIKTSTTAAQPVSSTPKTVVMTTLVGTKRVVLSVPAAPTTSLQGTGIAKSHGGGPCLTFTTASQSQALSKKDIDKATPPISTVCLPPSPTQLTPSHSACTVTTQVRSRPLPALLPAPPKLPIVTTTPTSNTTGSSRKLPTLLPAPAKVKAVIPTVLVPVRTSVVSTTAAQIQSSIPLVVTPAMSGVDVGEEYPDSEGQQCSTSAVPVSQGKVSTGPVSLHNEQNVMTKAQHVVDPDVAVQNADSTNQDICKSAFHCEQSTATEADNNTSSEDDSLLICSETIDSGGSFVDNSTTLQYYQGVGNNTSIKNSVMQVEQVLDETQPSLSGTNVGLVDTVCDSDLHTLELQKEVAFEQGDMFTVVKPVENVTVERLDGSGVICDALDNTLSHHPGTELLDANEHEKVYEAELDSAIHSDKENVILEDREQQQAAKDESLSHPMENALKVIASFVESMEGGSLGREEINHATDFPAQDTLSDLQSTDCVPFENSKSCNERLDVNCEKNSVPDNQDITSGSADSTQEQESDCNVILRYQEENWDTTSDANIDILSTSTSSCSSTPECLDLTEKEIKALETAANVRTSGRKRKPPWSLDVSPSRQVSGWVRGALSLLQKVASYRGQGRRRGDVGAATWFLKPVDPVDAPGYYKVIKTPMDFGTIRVKLETGSYQEYSEFHSDMLLVKSNCLKYNPPGHDVTQDCDEVFKFYETEYTKMLERWEKCHVSPAKKPRVSTKAESTM